MKQDVESSRHGPSPGVRAVLSAGDRSDAASGLARAFCVAVCLLATAPLMAAWTAADEKFTNYVIQQLKYFDTATRWLDLKSTERGLDDRARAQIAAKRLDILRAKGDDEGFARALEKFKQDYPWHPRASIGSLEGIGEKLGRVLAELERAAVADDEEAKTLREKAKQEFFGDVMVSLDALIDEHTQALAKMLEEVKDPLNNKAYQTRLVARYQALLARIRFYLNYGRKWPEGTRERKEALEKALELGNKFIDDGCDFYVMEYDAQLNRGIIAYELGRYLLASDHLGVLYDILPPSAPPYPPAVVTAIKDVRLQAILNGTRALSAAGDFREARRVIESHLLASRQGDPFDLSKAEDEPILRKMAVLARLEYAVALAGDGEVETALESIHAVIDRYSKSEIDEDKAYVTDARKALGRLAQIEGVTLRGQDYFQAARGLKSEFKFEEALSAFQTALGHLAPREFLDYAPLCLNEIAENLVLLGRYTESAVAYGELFESFGLYVDRAGIAARASKNFLHATTKAIETTPGSSSNPSWQALNQFATEQYERYAGSGLGATQALMVQANQLEREGEFEAARDAYRKVPEQIERDGETTRVPFYWRAQASAESMVFELWRRSDPNDANNPWTEALGRAIARLGEIVTKAIGTDDDGAATAALTLGQIYFLKEDWAAAEAALRVFAGPLKDLEEYRCGGVGYLTLSLSRQGKCDEARTLIESIRKPCKSSDVLGYAALNLSDCFYDAGDPGYAARYVLIYALHDSSKEDLRNLDTLLMVTSRLAEGATHAKGKTQLLYLKGNEKFLELAREHPQAKAPEYQRQLMLIDAKVYRARGEEEKAIAVLEKYIKDFAAHEGANPEDPYVYYDLGEIYWQRRSGGRGPTVNDALKAEEYYNGACALLASRRRVEPSLEPTFWRWVYRLMEVKLYLGNGGSTQRYGEIVGFLERRMAGDMGGLKAQFEQLLATAKEKKAERSR